MRLPKILIASGSPEIKKALKTARRAMVGRAKLVLARSRDELRTQFEHYHTEIRVLILSEMADPEYSLLHCARQYVDNRFCGILVIASDAEHTREQALAIGCDATCTLDETSDQITKFIDLIEETMDLTRLSWHHIREHIRMSLDHSGPRALEVIERLRIDKTEEIEDLERDLDDS